MKDEKVQYIILRTMKYFPKNQKHNYITDKELLYTIIGAQYGGMDKQDLERNFNSLLNSNDIRKNTDNKYFELGSTAEEKLKTLLESL